MRIEKVYKRVSSVSFKLVQIPHIELEPILNRPTKTKPIEDSNGFASTETIVFRSSYRKLQIDIFCRGDLDETISHIEFTVLFS